MIEPPFNLVYIIQLLKATGEDCQILDQRFNMINEAQKDAVCQELQSLWSILSGNILSTQELLTGHEVIRFLIRTMSSHYISFLHALPLSDQLVFRINFGLHYCGEYEPMPDWPQPDYSAELCETRQRIARIKYQYPDDRPKRVDLDAYIRDLGDEDFLPERSYWHSGVSRYFEFTAEQKQFYLDIIQKLGPDFSKNLYKEFREKNYEFQQSLLAPVRVKYDEEKNLKRINLLEKGWDYGKRII